MSKIDCTHAPLTQLSVQVVAVVDDYTDHGKLRIMKKLIAGHPPVWTS
jgi:hypothetical protein